MANLVIKGSGATPLSGAGRAGKSSPRGVGRAKAGSSGDAVSPSVAKLREIKSRGKESRKEVLEKGEGTRSRRRAVEKLLPEPVRDLVYEPLDFDRGQVPETVVSPASTPPTRVFLPPGEALTGVTYTPFASPYGRVAYRGEVPERLTARPTGRSGGAALVGEDPGGGTLSDSPAVVRLADATARLRAGRFLSGEDRRRVLDLLADPIQGVTSPIRDITGTQMRLDLDGAPVEAPASGAVPVEGPTRIQLRPGDAITGVTYQPELFPVTYRGSVPDDSELIAKTLKGKPTGRVYPGGVLPGNDDLLQRMLDKADRGRDHRIVAQLDKYRANIETLANIEKQAREDEAKALAVGLQARDMVSRTSSRLADAADRIPETVTGARRFNLSGYPGESVSDIEARVLGLSSDGLRQVGEVVSSPGKVLVAGVKKLDKAVSDVPFAHIVTKLWRSNPEAKFKIRDKARSWLAKHPGVVSAVAYAGVGYGLASMVSNRNRQVYEEGQRAAASVASGSNGPLGLAVLERVRALDDNLSEVARGRVSESNPLASADGVADTLAGIGGAMSRQVGGLLQSVDPADVKLGETIRRQAADDYNRVYQKLAKGLPSDYMARAMQYAAEGGSNVTPEAFAASLGLKDWRSDDAR